MKKLLILSAVLMSVPFVSFAQTGTTTGTQATATTQATVALDPGLLPGDFFYFFDRWTESLNLALTFNNEKKARKHLEYAKERIAEMSKVLENPTAKLEDVKSAKDNFNEQVAEAAAIVKEEKNKGNDVSELARELDDELDDADGELKDVLRGHGNEASRAEAEIRAKLATLSPTDPQVKGLTQALESIAKEKMSAMRDGSNVDASLSDVKAAFDEAMGKEKSAQKHIDEAMRLKARLEGLVGQLPADVVASSQALLDQARAADARGDFETAKRLSKQAKKVFENAQDAVEESANEMKEKNSGNDAIPGSNELQGASDVDTSHMNDLDQEIQKGERMMEGLRR